MKAFQWGLFLFLLMGLAHAADTKYEVEIIIFEDAAKLYDQSENWSETEAIIKKPVPTTAAEEPLEWMPEADYRLTKEAIKLRKSPDYNVLMHTAWKQQGLDKEQAFLIKINSLNKELYKPVKPVDTDTKKQIEESADMDKQEDTNPSYIDGTISLIMSRYLHFTTQLVFHKDISDKGIATNEIATPAYQEFPVIMERRMRSKEVHYIDHPMVGIIVLATPVKEDAKPVIDTRPDTYKTL